MKVNTSKFILVVNLLVAILLTAVVIVGTFLNRDMSQVTAVVVCWDGQLAITTGFYYWKAKNENRSKHAMGLVKELAEKHGIENVIELTEVVLKD